MNQKGKGYTKRNQSDLNGCYGIGLTYKGEKFIFDIEDYDKIKDYRWWFSRDGYLVACVNIPQRRMICFHKLIMGKAPRGKQIDHIRSTENRLDRKADNRKQNLRFVTRAQNSWNRGIRSDNTSGHIGVSWDKQAQRWLAKVRKGKKSKSKYFPENQFREACKWQEETAKKMHGKYAYAYN